MTDNTETAEISQRAIALAEAHGTPLTPLYFRFWYAYAEAGCAKFVALVDELLARSKDVAPEVADEAIRRFLAEGPSDDHLLDLTSSFDATLALVGKSVDGRIAASDAYTGVLTQESKKLSAKRAPEVVAAAIEKALAAANAERGGVEAFKEALDEARDEIRELRAKVDLLKHDAYVDQLTGLYNRRYFNIVADRAIDAARAEGAPLCMVVADIDHFKRVNDTWGHQTGDRVLETFAAMVRKTLRSTDTAARLGGEEFSIVLPQRSMSSASGMAEAIRLNLQAHRFREPDDGQGRFNVTVSLGVTELREDDNRESLMARVDELLYRAKKHGRNAVVAD